MSKLLCVLVSMVLLSWTAATFAAEPVAAVRVTFDRAGITSTQAHGLADIATGRVVTADDPARIASISKMIVAIGVMRLVEAGQLDLDADVSELLGWPLRHPGWPREPITLRLLLSHRAGLTDAAGYYQIPLGSELRELLADPLAWDEEHPPGTWFRYANLNFPLIASVMERATGERFDRLMDRLVLQPLGLDACYNWASCSDEAVARAIVQYDAAGRPQIDENRTGRPACPVINDGDCDLDRWQAGVNGALFSPQGGLRISANGLAKVGRLLLGEGTVDGVRLLSPESVRVLAQPAWTRLDGVGVSFEEDTSGESREGFFCSYGLAVQTLATTHPDCRDDLFADGVQRFGHTGSAYGLLSGLWVDPVSGTGIAYFVTGMSDAAPGNHSAFSAVIEGLAAGAPVDVRDY